MRILLVKLSSLGDIVHNFPVVTDIARALPHAAIDWAVEAPYADLVALHPAVSRIFPVHLRQFKKNWWQSGAWHDLLADRAALSAEHFDAILDTQGLIKSARIAGWAKGPITGFSRGSARESLAARSYSKAVDVPRDRHAIVRNRQLAATAFGYMPQEACDYGIQATGAALSPPGGHSGATGDKYVVFLHATSRADKAWDDSHWITLGKAVNTMGYAVVLPSGSAEEQAKARMLASQLAHAHAPATLPLTETAALLAHSRAVVGVDTGLSHLAVALGKPTIGLYRTTDTARTGLYGGGGGAPVRNLGSGTPEQPATVTADEAVVALAAMLTA